jgi:hypothetical protein
MTSFIATSVEMVAATATIVRVISMVIPVRDEPDEWWVEAARVARDFDVVIVDGSDRGGKPPGFPARVVHLPGLSRGARLDRGAREARGTILFFLHGDSRPPAAARSLIEDAVANGASAGCFRLAYQNATPALQWLAWWANLRTRWGRLPFGDQGVFCTREAYAATGGFRDLSVCDDVDFAWRLGKISRFAVLPAYCETSPRRYRGRTLRQVLLNGKVLTGYFLGVAPERLERWYRNP